MANDFNDIDCQIELNEKRLGQEYERTVKIRSRINYITYSAIFNCNSHYLI